MLPNLKDSLFPGSETIPGRVMLIPEKATCKKDIQRAIYINFFNKCKDKDK